MNFNDTKSSRGAKDDSERKFNKLFWLIAVDTARAAHLSEKTIWHDAFFFFLSERGRPVDSIIVHFRDIIIVRPLSG